MKTVGFILIAWLCVASSPVAFEPNNGDVCVSPEEKKLFDLIMEYRKSKKLKPLPYSAKLTKVAQAHV